MKKNLLVIALVSVSLFSCFEKKDDTKVETSTPTQIPTNQANSNASTLYGLTQAEAQALISKKIDPQKVSGAIKAAESGDEQAILGLAKLYLEMGDKVKAKKYLQMGADKNIPAAMYNLAVLYKQEGNTVEAEKLIAKLPKGAMNGAVMNGLTPQMAEGGKAYNQGLAQMKAKNYSAAKTSFQKAYSLGIKESDVQLGVIAKQQKNSKGNSFFFQNLGAHNVLNSQL